MLMHFRGTPNVGDVFLFAAGALAGFSILGVAAHRTLRMNDPLPMGPERVVVGIMHWFAVGIALGAVALVEQISSWTAWALGSFAGTVIYLSGASLQLALLARRGLAAADRRDALWDNRLSRGVAQPGSAHRSGR